MSAAARVKVHDAKVPPAAIRKGTPTAPVYFLLACIAAVLLHSFVPGAMLLYPPWDYSGLVLIVAGLLVGFLAVRQFQKVRTAVQPFDPSTRLVRKGVYRFTRNPMYLGLAIMHGGVCLLLGSATPWLAFAGLVAALNLRLIQPEERYLHARFGPAYAAYCDATRRWL